MCQKTEIDSYTLLQRRLAAGNFCMGFCATLLSVVWIDAQTTPISVIKRKLVPCFRPALAVQEEKPIPKLAVLVRSLVIHFVIAILLTSFDTLLFAWN